MRRKLRGTQVRPLQAVLDWGKSKLVVTCFTLAVFILPSSLQADLALQPGGVDISASAYGPNVVLDEDSVARTTGLSDFKMFGRTLPSTMHISVNGVLASSSLDFFYPTTLNNMPSNTQVIAPMFDDILMLRPDQLAGFAPGAPVNRIWEQKVAGSLYSVTWENVRLHLETETDANQVLTLFPSTVRSVQVALLGTAQTLRGFEFMANDILFAYESFDSLTSDFVDPLREPADPTKSRLNATIGLADSFAGLSQGIEIGGNSIDANNSEYVEATEAAGAGSGQTPRLPWDNQEFVLYRPETDMNGDFVRYNVSIERFTQAVPEPNCLLALAVASLGLFARRQRRQTPVASRAVYDGLLVRSTE